MQHGRLQRKRTGLDPAKDGGAEGHVGASGLPYTCFPIPIRSSTKHKYRDHVCWSRIQYVFGTRSTRIPRGKSPSSHHAAKKTHASDKQRLSLGPRHAQPLGLYCHYFLTLEGQEAANHVLPQPRRRRRALRFLGQCLHVSFRDTASTDAIYFSARVWREQVGQAV